MGASIPIRVVQKDEALKLLAKAEEIDN